MYALTVSSLWRGVDQMNQKFCLYTMANSQETLPLCVHIERELSLRDWFDMSLYEHKWEKKIYTS